MAVKGPPLNNVRQLKKLVSNQLRRVAISTQGEEIARAKIILDGARVLSDLFKQLKDEEDTAGLRKELDQLRKEKESEEGYRLLRRAMNPNSALKDKAQ